ncbi:MAG: monooxygenase [Myxococcota bacterium]
MILALFVACADHDYPTCDDDAPIPVRADVPTWHGEIRALVEARCGACHTDGGLAPVPFDTFEEAAPWAAAMATEVAAGTMPPWPPADCCRPLKDPLGLTPDEVGALAAWADGGAPEGDPASYVPPELPQTGLSRVDRTLEMDEPYTPAPDAGTTDDTRCFLLDWPEDEVRYVTGLGVNPGVPSQVHHALLLIAGPLTVPSFELLDAADSGPGWNCPGGVVWGTSGWIGGWSPGWTAREMPAGTGQKVAPGSKLILTVHYSVADGAPVADRTSVDLRLDDAVSSELTALSVYDPLWLAGGMKIPANEPDVWVSYKSRPLSKKTLVGVNLHMHERGSRGSIGIRHADGTEDCLLQIDDWQHHWQGDYQFAEPIQLAIDDQLWVECHWDNTAANQREVNGAPETPRDLGWAEDEEMCVGFLTARD